MIKHIVLTALALACAAPAVAEPVSIAVPYGDLDLTRDAGRKALDARLERAARKICQSNAPLREMWQMEARRNCLAEARGSYKAQVEVALNAANSRRVAMLADKLAVFAGF